MEYSSEHPAEDMMKTLSLLSKAETDNWEKDNNETIKGVTYTDNSANNEITEYSTLTMDDVPVEEGKEHLNIVFIGHVGKLIL
jgi:hypothetical protein